MSYRIIKNQEVGIAKENYKIPIIPTEGLYKNEHCRNIENIEQNGQGIQVLELIKKAENNAGIIIEEAKLKANSIKKIAEEDGYRSGFRKGQEEGYKQGYDRAIKEASEIKENAKQLLDNAHKESRQYVVKTKKEIIDLAASIAKSILHFNIDTRDESIIEMVRNALKHAEERKQIIIRSHPNLYLILQNNLYQFKKICPNANFTFLEDKGIKGRGCIIESEEQVIDLEIDSQLENIVSALLEMSEDNEL